MTPRGVGMARQNVSSSLKDGQERLLPIDSIFPYAFSRSSRPAIIPQDLATSRIRRPVAFPRPIRAHGAFYSTAGIMRTAAILCGPGPELPGEIAGEWIAFPRGAGTVYRAGRRIALGPRMVAQAGPSLRSPSRLGSKAVPSAPARATLMRRAGPRRSGNGLPGRGPGDQVPLPRLLRPEPTAGAISRPSRARFSQAAQAIGPPSDNQDRKVDPRRRVATLGRGQPGAARPPPGN